MKTHKLKVKKLTGISKAIGLIGKKITPVFFETRFGIHTFGVLYPIEVLVLDNGMRVVKIKENLKSNRIFFWNPRYKNIIEIPGKTIFDKKIKIGDEINLTD